MRPSLTIKQSERGDVGRRRRQAKMPWQSAPSLLIIIGAFNVAAGAMWGIQRIAYGKVRQKGGAIIDTPSSKSVGRVGAALVHVTYRYPDVLTNLLSCSFSPLLRKFLWTERTVRSFAISGSMAWRTVICASRSTEEH